jgi:hypothetical protein
VSAGLVLLVRRLRRPCEIDVHPRHGARAGTAGDAGRDGQVHTGVELASVDDLDERLVASWMRQAAAMPFFGGKKR